MRYKLDRLLEAEFKKQLSMLLANMTPAMTTNDKIVDRVLTRAFEFGFDAGCQACGIYSKELKELYSVSEMHNTPEH